MKNEIILPVGWPRPKGYSNGILAPAGARMLFVAGQIAWDEKEQLVGVDDFAAQFEKALSNVLRVVNEAGGEPTHLVRLTVYVVDKAQYLAALPEVGAAYRKLMGSSYPAMALVAVAGLVEDGALVEIEATAALPG